MSRGTLGDDATWGGATTEGTDGPGDAGGLRAGPVDDADRYELCESGVLGGEVHGDGGASRSAGGTPPAGAC